MDMSWGKKPIIINHHMDLKSQFAKNEPSFLEIINNKIYFYAEIEREKTLQLVKTIRQLNQAFDLQQREWEVTDPPCITLYISSYGGSIFAGLSVMDEIINSKVPVTTVVDGCCASAATLFSVVGKKRQIKTHSYMLIHQLSTGFMGKHQEFEDEIENQKKLMLMIKKIYGKYTKIPENTLEEMLKHDTWLDAQQCIEYGLVDEIIQGD